jgi:hypothetical protein
MSTARGFEIKALPAEIRRDDIIGRFIPNDKGAVPLVIPSGGSS